MKKSLTYLILALFVAVSILGVVGCSDDDDDKESSANDILTFTVTGQTGDAVIDTENHTVTVEVEAGTDLTSLSPTITVSDAATITPASGTAVDFSAGPVIYTVTAENGKEQEWTVTVALATIKVDVTFQVIDSTGIYQDLMIKGLMTGEDWPKVSMDDSNGDHVWEVTITDIEAGTYEWGFVENYEEAGLDMWMVEGANLEFTIAADGTITGTTTYTIPAFELFASRFIIVDGTQSYQKVMIKGTMTGEDWPTVDMSQDGHPNIWTLMITDIPEGDHEWGAIEDDGSEWGIWLIDGANRQFSVSATGEVTGQIIYVIPAPSEKVSVTFQVDMTDETVSNVYIAGNFGGDGYAEWDPGAIELTDDDEDNIYTVTLDLTPNKTYNYKYINGVGWDAQETVPEECGVDDGYGAYNREFVVPENDADVPVHPFGGCPE